MNDLEVSLRSCKAEFGEKETLALASLLFSDAGSKSQKQKIIRTAALVLGAKEKEIARVLEKLDSFLISPTILSPDGEEILKGGEFVWGGGEDA